MNSTLQMIDPLPLALGRKVVKPREQTEAEHKAECHALSVLAFEKLPYSLAGVPMLGVLPNVPCRWVPPFPSDPLES